MRAAIFENMHISRGIAHHDHRAVADKGAAPIAGVGDFRFQRHIVPASAAEDALLLAGVQRRIGIHPVGNARDAFLGPVPSALAAKLSMATLTRAWTLLLKGLRETLDAPSPLRAAEMVQAGLDS